jgi:hypothetical protein
MLISNQPEKLNLDYYRNDTAPGLNFVFTGIPAITSVRMVIKSGEIAIKTFTTANESIVVAVDGQTTTITINSWTVDIEPISYFYDLEVTHTGGTIKTYFAGKIIVTKDVS